MLLYGCDGRLEVSEFKPRLPYSRLSWCCVHLELVSSLHKCLAQC